MIIEFMEFHMVNHGTNAVVNFEKNYTYKPEYFLRKITTIKAYFALVLCCHSYVAFEFCAESIVIVFDFYNIRFTIIWFVF